MFGVKVLLLGFFLSTIRTAESFNNYNLLKETTFFNKLAEQRKKLTSETEGRGIIGGFDSEKGVRNYQLSLQVKVTKPIDTIQHFCGASVLNETWVLTAAHCLDVDFKKEMEIEEYELLVVAGEYKLNKEEGEEQVKKIEKFFIHPDYNKGKDYANDIALIKIAEKFKMNDYVRKIALPFERQTSYGRECIISGWGDIDIDLENAVYPEILQENKVPIVSDEECQISCEEAIKEIQKEESNFKYDCDILQNAMCGGYKEGGVDTCQGDSGGPVACKDYDGSYYQAGIVSYGLGCALPGLYGVYTEVSYFTDWIDTVMRTGKNTESEKDTDNGAIGSVVLHSYMLVLCYFFAVLLK